MDSASPDLDFSRHGAERFRGAVRDSLETLESALAHLPPYRAGIRLSGIDSLKPFLIQDGPIGSIASSVLVLTAVLSERSSSTRLQTPTGRSGGTRIGQSA